MVKLRKPVMVHGYMIYGCDHCGRVFTMFLENGIEDAEGDALGHPHKLPRSVFPASVEILPVISPGSGSWSREGRSGRRKTILPIRKIRTVGHPS